jgi:hypothetical protein
MDLGFITMPSLPSRPSRSCRSMACTACAWHVRVRMACACPRSFTCYHRECAVTEGLANCARPPPHRRAKHLRRNAQTIYGVGLYCAAALGPRTARTDSRIVRSSRSTKEMQLQPRGRRCVSTVVAVVAVCVCVCVLGWMGWGGMHDALRSGRWGRGEVEAGGGGRGT